MKPINYGQYSYLRAHAVSHPTPQGAFQHAIVDGAMLLEACRERDAVLETLEISYRARIAELELENADLTATVNRNGSVHD